MPFICGGLVSLALEHMSKVSTAVGADDLCPRHSESAVCMSRHGTRNIVEVCGPPAAGLELVGRRVKWRIACSASVDALFRHVLVIFSSEWSFGALFAEDAKLFWIQ